jgi:hypothetical protein
VFEPMNRPKRCWRKRSTDSSGCWETRIQIRYAPPWPGSGGLQTMAPAAEWCRPIFLPNDPLRRSRRLRYSTPHREV